MRVDFDTLVDLLDDTMLLKMKDTARPLLGAVEAEDAVSEAVTYLLGRCRREPIEMTNPTAYLVRCAYNAALRALEQRQRHTPVASGGAEIGDAPSVFAVPHSSSNATLIDALDIEACVRRLPPRYREAIVLQIWAGLRIVDIAEVTGVGEKTVEKRLHEARARLAECLAVRD